MSGSNQTKLQAMKKFREAVTDAVDVLGAGPLAIEVLKALVHEGQAPTQSWPTPLLRLGRKRLPVPTDAANLELMRKLRAEGKSRRMVRSMVISQFAGTGVSREQVERRLEIYYDLLSGKRRAS